MNKIIILVTKAMINLYDKYDFKLFDSRLKSDYNALKEQMLISEIKKDLSVLFLNR